MPLTSALERITKFVHTDSDSEFMIGLCGTFLLAAGASLASANGMLSYQ